MYRMRHVLINSILNNWSVFNKEVNFIIFIIIQYLIVNNNIPIKFLSNILTSGIWRLLCKTQIDLSTCHLTLLLWIKLNGDNLIVFICIMSIVAAIIYILLHQKSWHVVGTLTRRTFWDMSDITMNEVPKHQRHISQQLDTLTGNEQTTHKKDRRKKT